MRRSYSLNDVGSNQRFQEPEDTNEHSRDNMKMLGKPGGSDLSSVDEEDAEELKNCVPSARRKVSNMYQTIGFYFFSC